MVGRVHMDSDLTRDRSRFLASKLYGRIGCMRALSYVRQIQSNCVHESI